MGPKELPFRHELPCIAGTGHDIRHIEIRVAVRVSQAEGMPDFVGQQFVSGILPHDDLRAKIRPAAACPAINGIDPIDIQAACHESNVVAQGFPYRIPDISVWERVMRRGLRVIGGVSYFERSKLDSHPLRVPNRGGSNTGFDRVETLLL